MLQVFLMLLFALASLAPASAQADKLKALEPLISHATRLIVFSPHPDDESLGAAGLIQRVLGAGGKVRIVFMTSGDGFPEGVEKENHISHPGAKDYRKYGAERREEAVKATALLGVKERDVIFLGFPDGGLSYLRLRFRAHPLAYRSPFTRENHPPAFECLIPQTDYSGRDLSREVERVIAEFQPTLVVTTPPEDQHPDHNATYYFVKKALGQWKRKNPNCECRMFTFLIHFGQWPIAQGAGAGLHLDPPEGFPDRSGEWISLQLKPEEIETKRKAIMEYRTQMLVMGRFLMSFARSNELWLPED
jgi:LmbE family N-acetylglucosaminyl deacetylase